MLVSILLTLGRTPGPKFDWSKFKVKKGQKMDDGDEDDQTSLDALSASVENPVTQCKSIVLTHQMNCKKS